MVELPDSEKALRTCVTV